jgi:hypothetical protein
VLNAPAVRSNKVRVEWHGRPPLVAPVQKGYSLREKLEVLAVAGLAQVDDPRRSLVDGRVSVIGFHTVFANVQVGDCRWSMPISFEVMARLPGFAEIPRMAAIGPVNR